MEASFEAAALIIKKRCSAAAAPPTCYLRKTAAADSAFLGPRSRDDDDIHTEKKFLSP